MASGEEWLPSFQAALDTSFHLDVNGRGADLTLVDVAVSDRHPGWETFSLLFDGPSPPAFWDGTFAVEHPSLGSFPLFLVAVQTDGDGQLYQAVVNRPRPEPPTT